MKRLLQIFILVTISLFGVDQATSQSSLSSQCRIGIESPRFGFWTWPRNSTVKVYVLATDFKAEELRFLLLPVANWSAVSELTGSGVKFEYAGAVPAPLYCENCLTILRGKVFDKTKRHATELRTYSARRDQIMTWAHIVVDSRLTDPSALSDAIAHELGHNLGLLDCFSCRQRSTVMNQFKNLNVPNGMNAPSTCDIAQVTAAFKELARHVRPALLNQEDEGEEPVDDDTPVVVRKPRL